MVKKAYYIFFLNPKRNKKSQIMYESNNFYLLSYLYIIEQKIQNKQKSRKSIINIYIFNWYL